MVVVLGCVVLANHALVLCRGHCTRRWVICPQTRRLCTVCSQLTALTPALVRALEDAGVFGVRCVICPATSALRHNAQFLVAKVRTTRKTKFVSFVKKVQLPATRHYCLSHPHLMCPTLVVALVTCCHCCPTSPPHTSHPNTCHSPSSSFLRPPPTLAC